MATTGGTKPPKTRSKRESDRDLEAEAIQGLQATVCDIGMMISSNPELPTVGKTRVIVSMRRRYGKQTWRSPYTHRIRSTFRRLRYITTKDGTYGVTEDRRLIRFVEGPICDSERYAVEARYPGREPLPLMNKWFFADYGDFTREQADALRVKLEKVLPRKRRYRTRS